MNTMGHKIDVSRLKFGDDTVVEEVDLDEVEIFHEGERLTEARAEAIAQDVLAEVRRRNLSPGGKSLSGDGSRSPTIQVTVSKETESQFAELARQRKMSRSKLARKVLEDWIAQHQPESQHRRRTPTS